MYKTGWIASVLLLSLAGCAMGVSQDGSSPQRAFKVPVSFSDAYATAQRQANNCLRGENQAYQVQTQLDASKQTGVVQVLAPYLGGVMALVNLQAVGAKETAVKVTMWGPRPWDKAAIQAMHEALLYSVSSCQAYMPEQLAPQ